MKQKKTPQKSQNYNFVDQFDEVERIKILKLSQETLWSSEGEKGKQYLFEKRKIKEETAKKFKLGYVPSGVDHQLVNRIIFPIFDSSDNLISLTSRSIDNNSHLPIYWHERFNKSFYLYGLDLSKQRIRQTGFAVSLEGNFDVIQCYDKGLTNIVGLMGLSISEMQISLLLRYCENVIFIFDNDENKAGQKAADRVENILQKYNSSNGSLLNYGFVRLKDANDPDDYIKENGIIALKKMIKSVKDEISAY